jgi:hypothetical protein
MTEASAGSKLKFSIAHAFPILCGLKLFLLDISKYKKVSVIIQNML